MSLSRRRFLSAASVSLGLAGLRSLFDADRLLAVPVRERFGPLLPDPEGILALPRGFSYTIFSRAGEEMDDGLLVPARHDGMAAFPGADGLTLLVRNHEVSWRAPSAEGPFGEKGERLELFPPESLYDPGSEGEPALGGSTTLLFDTREQRLLGHRLSLAGTLRNCAGGPTPWGSWLSCEETAERAGDGRARDHGWVFEVPADWDAPPADPAPLTALGRFNHEAVAVHDPSGCLYLTEDESEGLLYRFVPEEPGRLRAGGRLQALAVRDRPSLDTRNWDGSAIAPTQRFGVGWIDLDEVASPLGDLRHRGFAAGAARFARGEGIWAGDDGIYFACTDGGATRAGQIWRYLPSPDEGSTSEAERPGGLELFLEPDDSNLVERADSLTTAPWGDLVLCEDGTGEDRLLGVTAEGELYQLARCDGGSGELAGACFSPDGSTLFVNMQGRGWTLAITGPWHEPFRP